MLLNHEGKVWVGERLDCPGAFQMPQGGIDDGEDIQDALFRELEEETGIAKNAVRLIAFSKIWHQVMWPKEIQHKVFKGQYKGQLQKWALCRLIDTKDPSNLNVQTPEFVSYKWVDVQSLVSLVVDFKKEVYTQVIEEFSSLCVLWSIDHQNT